MIDRTAARLNLAAAVRLVFRALKTEAYYERVIQRGVRDLYNGKIDAGAFADTLYDLVQGQLTRAWNEGMRDVGLDPADITDEWAAVLQQQIDDEQAHIVDFALAVEAAAASGSPIEPFQTRADLWVSRYRETVDLARVTCEPRMNFRWELGATEEHCTTCAALDGLIASGADWEASGYRPQNPPNDRLDCGGWRCDCRLTPTDEKATQEGPPSV